MLAHWLLTPYPIVIARDSHSVAPAQRVRHTGVHAQLRSAHAHAALLLREGEAADKRGASTRIFLH
jgi:hypothetical protein